MELALEEILPSHHHADSRSKRGESRNSNPIPHNRTPHTSGPTTEMPMPYTCEGLSRGSEPQGPTIFMEVFEELVVGVDGQI